jgi:hypothetical protein
MNLEYLIRRASIPLILGTMAITYAGHLHKTELGIYEKHANYKQEEIETREARMIQQRHITYTCQP